ncbi:MAG: DNA-formamidopyrimidine glycosylase [Kordiimonas sp.]|nr:DNA-formamidopyrimidine glycosylase [Kordiimonas sp.]|tara:strand:+ start:301 stop:1149 length:849 start_codon:yes stop_codon:yes gene_type:complete
MPELPEVETVCRGMRPLLDGAILSEVIVRRSDLRFPLPPDFAARLTGQQVVRLRRRAKYILMEMADGQTVIMHLGMSGRIKLIAAADQPSARPLAKHDHVVFITDRGDYLVYNDPRRFGFMDMCAGDTLLSHKLFRDMGPEPLGNEFHPNGLTARLAGRKVAIKQALLDQKNVVGLGNIYVCEALFEAGISPFMAAGQVTMEQLERLVPRIQQVLRRAIEAGGSTLKDYARVDGELGYFQHSFRVYGREGEACKTKGCSSMIARAVQGGRSTFYCPVCQHVD